LYSTFFEISFSSVDNVHNKGQVVLQVKFANKFIHYYTTEGTNGCSIEHANGPQHTQVDSVWKYAVIERQKIREGGPSLRYLRGDEDVYWKG